MILVPKIGPHGLCESSDRGLFRQIAESAALDRHGDLVRGFRRFPYPIECLNALLTRRDNKWSHV